MLQSLKLAIKSIWSNKMRSFLTMLGIIIGVAAVIILVSLVNGYMNYMMESFTSMGTNQITVRLTNLTSRHATVDQMYTFFDEHQDLFLQMTPQVSVSSATLKNGSDSLTTTSVTGVSEQYIDMKSFKIETGRFITYADLLAKQKSAVIGYYVAEELYGSTEKAIDQKIKINGYAFNIVGVIERQDSTSLEEGGSDDICYIPYSTATKMTRSGIPNSYVFATVDTTVTEDAVSALTSFLTPIYQSTNLFHITAMSEMLDSLNSMMSKMSLMLGGIAGISLLVAGVGVMNIMLVSVTERTREIGIRKALGARPGVIMQQFVMEALLTSMLGGLIGIGLGSVLSNIVGAAMSISAPPTASAILVSFSVSVFIGLVFGYMPASRAAKLNPIDALRSE
jgi:putative ABC transport system permease protein